MNRHPRAFRRANGILKGGLLIVLLAAFSSTGAYATWSSAVTGGPMSVTAATLTAPSGLTAARSCPATPDLGTSLSWTASTSSATSGYSILRSTSSTGGFSSVGTVSGINATTYTDSMSPPAAADSLYVAVKSANGMDTVSLSSGTKTANSGGANLKNPTAIAVTPDGTTAYLANSGGNTVTPVTLSSDTAAPAITVGPKPPTDLAVTSDGSTVWVADGTGNVVTPVTVATNTAGTQTNVGFNATAIAITPNGSTAWIVGQNNAISLNLSTLALGPKITQGGGNFTSVAITPSGTTAYVTDAGNKEIWPINLATGAWGTAIGPFAFPPQGIAISPGGTTAWVDGQTDIVPITLATAAVGTGVTVAGAAFQGLAITPNGCWVYAADASKNNQIVPVSTTTDTEGTPVATDPSPEDIATAYPWATYYYEVEATRDLWTSPASNQASLAFGQPPLSVAIAPPSITSAPAAAFTSGVAGSFEVTATGGPTPSFSESGTLPSGVTFVDNADGTATISGTPASTGSYAFTITATNTQGSVTQNFTLNVYSASLVASGNSTSGTTLTSGSFTLSSGSAYLVLAMTNDATAGTNTMSVGAGSAFSADPTFTQVGSQQNYNNDGAHYTAWYLSGGTGSGTVTVTVTNPIKDAYVEVIEIQGAAATAPLVTSSEGFANAGTTAGASASADLSAAPAAGDYELVFENNVGDAGPGSPSSSSFTLVPSSYLHGGGGAGASVSAFTGGATQTATVTIGSGVIWGTMAVEIAHP